MTTVVIGNLAEQAAADWLTGQGFRVLQRNFRRPYCEIDIIAGKNRTIHFVEVKYRSTTHQGSGLDYITPLKLRHTTRAAAVWVARQRWRGEYTLSAIEVTGPGYAIGDFIESLY